MEIPVAAGPWLVLGVVLGLLLSAATVLAVGALRRGRAPARSAPPPPDPRVDDLPGFLESPPGSAPAPDVPAGGWAALGPPPAAPVPEPVAEGGGGTRGALVAMAVTALLLVGAAAGVAALRRDDRPDGVAREPAGAARRGDVSAELTFGGIVLERRAVGVTATYPRVRVTVRNGRPAADLELPTYNCLRDFAPVDPGAAGCSRTVTEYAALTAPQLDLRPDGDGFRISGAFPTSRRPNGSPPVATGRVYDLAVAVAPRDGTRDEGSEPATGEFALGGDRVGTSAEGLNRISYGG